MFVYVYVRVCIYICMSGQKQAKSTVHAYKYIYIHAHTHIQTYRKLSPVKIITLGRCPNLRSLDLGHERFIWRMNLIMISLNTVKKFLGIP